MHEVVGVGDGTLAGGLQATADQITWGHRQTIPGLPMPMHLPPRERAVRGQKLLRAGPIGPGDTALNCEIRK